MYRSFSGTSRSLRRCNTTNFSISAAWDKPNLMNTEIKEKEIFGRGGGLVVITPAFYSDDPSLNPAGT